METTYAVVDAGGEYIGARYTEHGLVAHGRTPASNEAMTWETREEAAEAIERATDRVVEMAE